MSTAALAAEALAGRQSPELAPSPKGAPRRRIPGSTTEPLRVRACSGESVGRHPSARRAPRAVVEAPALRLTRRGRMLVTALSVLVFGSAIVVLGLRVAGVLEPGPDLSHTVPVQVAPGQTLWSIAQDTNPGQDTATVVEKIADLNKLSGPADLVPGQTVQVPVAH